MGNLDSDVWVRPYAMSVAEGILSAFPCRDALVGRVWASRWL